MFRQSISEVEDQVLLMANFSPCVVTAMFSGTKLLKYSVREHFFPTIVKRFLEPGSHLCDKHSTSEIRISASTRTQEHV